MCVCVCLVVYSQDEDLRMDYECVLAIEGRSVVVAAFVKRDESEPFLFYITCQLQQVLYSSDTNTLSSIRYYISFMDYK